MEKDLCGIEFSGVLEYGICVHTMSNDDRWATHGIAQSARMGDHGGGMGQGKVTKFNGSGDMEAACFGSFGTLMF